MKTKEQQLRLILIKQKKAYKLATTDYERFCVSGFWESSLKNMLMMRGITQQEYDQMYDDMKQFEESQRNTQTKVGRGELSMKIYQEMIYPQYLKRMTKIQEDLINGKDRVLCKDEAQAECYTAFGALTYMLYSGKIKNDEFDILCDESWDIYKQCFAPKQQESA